MVPLVLAALTCSCAPKSPFHTYASELGERVPERKLQTVERFPAEEFIAPEPPGPVDPAADRFAGVERIELSLEQARAWALEHNLDLQVALIDPVIANQVVNEEEGRFDWVFTNDFTYTKLDQPTASELNATALEDWTLTPGVRIPMRTGGTIEVNLPFNRTETNNVFSTLNPAFETDLTVSVSQPLLRGAGRRANTHAIRIASLNEQISRSRTKLEVIRQLAAVERAYWFLYAAARALEVTQVQYELAAEQLERAERFVQAGRSAEVEIVRAEAGVAERLEAIILADNAVRQRQRDLKRLLNVDGLEIDTPTLLVTSTPPDPVHYEFDGSALADWAVGSRMEMLELELQLAQDLSTIDFERNNALPLFTVDYIYRGNGLGDGFEQSLDQLKRLDFEDHVVSVRGEVPIGNNFAKARVQRSILQRLQRLSTVDARRLAIRQEVLNALDNVESSWQRILAARQSAILDARVYNAEQRQFEVGARTSTEVLDAATQLADSQLAEIRALGEYQIALTDLAFATGTLMGSARVDWSPLDPRDPATSGEWPNPMTLVDDLPPGSAPAPGPATDMRNAEQMQGAAPATEPADAPTVEEPPVQIEPAQEPAGGVDGG